MTSRARVAAGATIAIVVLAVVLMTGSQARALTGNYTIALIQVSYSDVSIHRYTQADLTSAAGEIESYFSQLSNGQLTMHVRIGQATLTHARSYYWTDCSAGQANCPPDLLQDAVTGAEAGGLSMSGVQGVAVVDPLDGGWTNGPRPVSTAGGTSTVQQSWLSEDCTTSGCPAAGFTAPGASGVYWNGWAHEIGHQIEHQEGADFSGDWNGHPGGYSSAYDLMESCYPCGESLADLTDPQLSGNRKFVFPGWLSETKVATMAAPSSGTATQTFSIAPIAEASSSTSYMQGVRLPISPGVYYTIDARRRAGLDALDHGRNPLGIWSEGIELQYVDESQNPEVHDIDACDYTVSGGCVRSSADSRSSSCDTARSSHAYCWPYFLWRPGDVAYHDAAANITITVLSYDSGTNTYSVRVTRGRPSGAPDISITPWQTPPGNTWETKDIWVDSSCNGIGAFRYGIDPSTSLPSGNGDDPCANHPNRLYASITNLGTQPAVNVRVEFASSHPLGVGVTPSTGWDGIGEANQGTFPALASIPRGATVQVWVPWNPSIDTSTISDMTSFAFHSCVRVRILPSASETVVGNNEAQENINYFQADVSGGMQRRTAAATQTILGSVLLRNVDTKPGVPPRTYYLSVDPNLPPDAGYYVPRSVTLAPGTTRRVPFKVAIPGDEPPGKYFSLDVSAWTIVQDTNPAIPDLPGYYPHHTESMEVGGDRLVIHTVRPTKLALSAAFGGYTVYAKGSLNPPPTGAPKNGARLTLDYLNAGRKVATHLVTINPDGSFKDSLKVKPSQKSKRWKVRAIWAGTQIDSSALVLTPVK